VPRVPAFSTAARKHGSHSVRPAVGSWQIDDHAEADLEKDLVAELVGCDG
jgi:hypothetical protein